MQGITQGGLHMLEITVPPSKRRPRFSVVLVTQLQYRVELERQKVQQKEYLAGMLLPVPKVVLQMVPAVFQYVIMLVLYLPPRSRA